MNWIIILLGCAICGSITAIIIQEQRIKRIEIERDYWVSSFTDVATKLLKLSQVFEAIGGNRAIIKEIVIGKDKEDEAHDKGF